MRHKPKCYHRRTDCGFCGSWHTREPLGATKRKPRCVACGRFTSKREQYSGEHCNRCVERGFFALQLDLAA